MANKPFFKTKVGAILKGAASVIAPGLVKALEGATSVADAIGLIQDNTDISAEHKYELRKLAIESERIESENTTRRWEADSNSDSAFTRIIRPSAYAFMTVIITALVLIDTFSATIEVPEVWVGFFTTIYTTMTIAYFSSRGAEKIFKK